MAATNADDGRACMVLRLVHTGNPATGSISLLHPSAAAARAARTTADSCSCLSSNWNAALHAVIGLILTSAVVAAP
jgi:hypothetical protein